MSETPRRPNPLTDELSDAEKQRLARVFARLKIVKTWDPERVAEHRIQLNWWERNSRDRGYYS